jgi:hypothetical protein
MAHLTTTKPYYCLTGMPGPVGFAYNCDEVGTEILCNPAYILNDFDTEPELADFVDSIVGEPGWYYKCDNRIPYPPNLVEWDLGDCADPVPEP